MNHDKTELIAIGTKPKISQVTLSLTPVSISGHNIPFSQSVREEKPKKAVFLTDSLSALQALMSDEPDTTQKKLTENINTLAQTTYVVLQWIPAHTGIRGNEMADQLAKEGREKEQPPSHLSYREVKTLIHNKKKAIFHSKTKG